MASNNTAAMCIWWFVLGRVGVEGFVVGLEERARQCLAVGGMGPYTARKIRGLPFQSTPTSGRAGICARHPD